MATRASVWRRCGLALYYWLPVAAWMGLIFYLSAQPDFDFLPEEWTVDPVSLLAHFGEYAILAALLWRAARHSVSLSRRPALFVMLVAVLYAATDEFHQAFVPGRVSDIRDWLVDGWGAMVVLWLLTRRDIRS